MTDAQLARTALHKDHVALGAKLVDFGGWSMPIQYDSIVTEHDATRKSVSLFDVSHMARFRFDGGGAAAFLDGLVTRKVANLKDGQIRYGLMVNEQGGILDDVLVYKLIDHDGEPYHAMVVNAGNREKIASVIEAHLPADDVQFTDQTLDTAMIAVQGPRAIELTNPFLDTDLSAMKYYYGANCKFGETPITCSRTGYTGEDGCELSVPASAASTIWNALMERGQSVGIAAAGLGARDTLRLEAAMPLYGHELNEDIHPYQAGLGFAVNLKGRSFVGSEALTKLREAKNHPVRIGLKLAGKRVPREGYAVLSEGRQIGQVTSGTFSPTLQVPLAMAYVEAGHEAKESLEIDIRGKQHAASICELPFYDRSKMGVKVSS
jgi:aminomethyltransferase